MKIDGYAYANKGEMDEIQEEVDEDVSSSKEEVSQKSENQESKINKSKDELSEELGVSGEKSDNYEKEINDLEDKIEALKEDNEYYQRRINLIFEFRKKEGREEKNF